MKFTKLISIFLIFSIFAMILTGCSPSSEDNSDVYVSILPNASGTTSDETSSTEAEDLPMSIPKTIYQAGKESEARHDSPDVAFKYSINIPDWELYKENFNTESSFIDDQYRTYNSFYNTRSYLSPDKKLLLFVSEYYGTAIYPPDNIHPTWTIEGEAESISNWCIGKIFNDFCEENNYNSSFGYYHTDDLIEAEKFDYVGVSRQENINHVEGTYFYGKGYVLMNIQFPIVIYMVDFTSDHSYEEYIDSTLEAMLASVKMEKRYMDGYVEYIPH